MKFSVEPGEHELYTEVAVAIDRIKKQMYEAGKTYYLHYSMSSGGYFYVPGVIVTSNPSTQFYITTKQHAFEVMPQLAGVK